MNLKKIAKNKVEKQKQVANALTLLTLCIVECHSCKQVLNVRNNRLSKCCIIIILPMLHIKVHATIIVCSSLVTTHGGLNWMDLVLPFKWFIREFIDKFHDLLGLSAMNVTISMAVVILPMLQIGILLTCGNLCQFSYVMQIQGEFFHYSMLANWTCHHLWSTFKFMVVPLFFGLTSTSGECVLDGPIRSMAFIFLNTIQFFFKNGLNHDMLVMHVILWFNTRNENINVWKILPH